MSEIAEDRSSSLTRVAILMLVASLGFIQLPIAVFGQNLVLTDIIFLFLLASWLFDVLRLGYRPRWRSFYWLLLFYSGALALSCVFSADPRQSFSRLPAEIYLPLLTAVVADVVRTSAGLRSSLIAWLGGTAFAVTLGTLTIALFYAQPNSPLLDYLTYHYGAVPVGNYPRITSTFVSASMLCNYLNVSLILTIMAAASGWISNRLAWVVGSLIFICSVFTISVGLGGVFLGLGLVYYLFRSTRRSFRVLALATSSLIALVFLVLSAVALRADEVAALAPSGRILVWREAFQTFAENAFTGHGLGLSVANVVFQNAEGSFSLLTDAHNTYLNIAAQAGLAGLAAMIAITVFVLAKWKGAARPNKIAAGLGAAFLCAFVYQGLTGSFEHARHLWVLMGLFAAAVSTGAKADQNS
ncbi:MAG TPA: O-antigen ligase family protein [Pyrinomonadaceae bacterium]